VHQVGAGTYILREGLCATLRRRSCICWSGRPGRYALHAAGAAADRRYGGGYRQYLEGRGFRQGPARAAILGGHIEFNSSGETFDWGSQYHPHEHALPLTKADLLRLPAALPKFNGFDSRVNGFIMMNQMHNLIAVAVAAGAVVLVLIVGLWRYVRRRRKRRAMA
jgi:hypothetical protein